MGYVEREIHIYSRSAVIINIISIIIIIIIIIVIVVLCTSADWVVGSGVNKTL